MKYILLLILMLIPVSSFGSECSNGTCSLRNRVGNIVSVPVNVARRTFQTSRNLGRRTANSVRNTAR